VYYHVRPPPIASSIRTWRESMTADTGGGSGDTGQSVAILGGTGAEGSGLALRWAMAGFRVIIGSREAARAGATAESIRGRVGAAAQVEGRSNADAVGESDFVVLTVPFSAQLATLSQVKDRLQQGSVLIDVTVPLATAVGGRPTQMLGVWAGSAAEQAAAAVPQGIGVVAAFHHVSAHALAAPDHAIETDVLVCGDSRAAKERVRPLVEAIAGARYVDAGPLANARIVESLTALLVGINIRYKVPGSGIRITGLESGS
jgi:NADPH-dependent F420 reductase